MKNIRKYIVALGFASFLIGSATAAPLTPEAALNRAQQDAPQKVRSLSGNMHLTSTQTLNGVNTIYLFTPSNGNGFVAVAADDAVDALVGYGTNSLTDANGKMAPEFQYWLNEISRQVSYAAECQARGVKKNVIKKARPERDAIAPQCEAKWYQDYPYNKYCPKVDGTLTYTGCAATAMAIVMKYHNWPETGQGSKSYKWNGKTLSIDFSRLKFKWDKMLNTYEEDNYTSDEANAVALLMQAAGYSIEMGYGTDESGAATSNLAPAFGKYFRYDKSMKAIYRDYYTLTEWEEIIYNDLVNYGPVLYTGQSNDGGHAFVCDGYDKDGYFHINWGWGGSSDGYYLLDLLDPYTQGIGGSGDNSGFNYSQYIVTGLRPDRTGDSEWTESLLLNYGLNLTVNEDEEGYKYLTFKGSLYNPGPADIPSGSFGIRVRAIDADGNVEEDGEETLYELDEPLGAYYGYSDFDIDCIADLADGDYLLDMVFYDSHDNMSVVKAKVYDNTTVHLHIENGEYTTTRDYPSLLEMAYFTYPDMISTSDPFNITGTLFFLEDASHDYFGALAPIIVSLDDNLVAVGQSVNFDMFANSTYDVNYTGKLVWATDSFTEPGDYYIALCTTNSAYYQPVTELYPVYVSFESLTEVANIATEEQDATPSYYTLTGIYVGSDKSRLSNGIYIEKRNGKAKKLKIEN